MAHTKGPWNVRALDGRVYIAPGDSAEALAEVFNLDSEGDVARDYLGIARLIAAAPELLEALQAIGDALAGRVFNVGDPILNAAKIAAHAIAKATKEG